MGQNIITVHYLSMGVQIINLSFHLYGIPALPWTETDSHSVSIFGFKQLDDRFNRRCSSGHQSKLLSTWVLKFADGKAVKPN
jgi:hypothetical protein